MFLPPLSSKRGQLVLEGLSDDTKHFWAPKNIPHVSNPSPITFLRDYVSTYNPVIITDLIDDWPALNWTLHNLGSSLPKSVNVNFSFNGQADSVQSISCVERFIYPAECNTDWSLFADMLLHPCADDAIPYLSQQNDNLRNFFPTLLEDIDQSFELAEAAFGLSSPEAINLWIGDERSISSVHKDFFENLYVVLSGEKTFVLLPPTDIAFMPENEYPTLIHSIKNKELIMNSNLEPSLHERLKLNDMELADSYCPSPFVSWIPIDPLYPDECIAKYPPFKYATPIYCTVKAGELLYIPSMWYHRVSQTCLTIAVNYWYDQRFDFRYSTLISILVIYKYNMSLIINIFYSFSM